MRGGRHCLLLLLLFWLALGGSQAAESVDSLLIRQIPPPGVVFEIVEGEDDALGWALPEVIEQARRLRERFPEIELAVVSHGIEQFALRAIKATRRRGQR